MATLKRKEYTLDAELYDPANGLIPAGVSKGKITTLQGEKKLNPGDYVITDENGDKDVLTAAKVAKAYEVVEEETFDHEITKEDLNLNPDLSELGVKEGDIVQIPVNEDTVPVQETVVDPITAVVPASIAGLVNPTEPAPEAPKKASKKASAKKATPKTGDN